MPSRARRTAVAPVPHPRSSARNQRLLLADGKGMSSGWRRRVDDTAFGVGWHAAVVVGIALEAFAAGLGDNLLEDLRIHAD